MKNYIFFLVSILFFVACNEIGSTSASTTQKENKHHLNIPEKGIESLMEANSQKIIEGTDGSIVIKIGNVTRKEADITIQREDKIVEEKMVAENENFTFSYEEKEYTISVGKIKKPLVGEGKVSLSIK